MKRLAGGIVALALCWTAGGAPSPQATVWPSAEWQVATPESVGLDSARLKGVLERVQERGWRVDSIQVVRHGKLVLDAYFYPYAPGRLHDLRSVTKSVTSSLLGLSIAQGRWPDVNVPVLSQFPERTFEAVDAWKKAMTLGDLVNMSSGLAWFFQGSPSPGDASSYAQMFQTKDWVGFVLNQPMAFEPGSLFLYNNGNFDVLAALIGRAWHQPAREVARERLFRPIGISRFEWAVADPDGNTLGAASLALAPRDMARLGLLWLHDGVWQDQRLLPAGWTGKLLAEGDGLWAGGSLYKRGFWIDTIGKTFRALGQHCQLIMVDPTLDMIVVVTSKTADQGEGPSKSAGRPEVPCIFVMNEIRYMVSENGDVPENPSAQAELRALLQKIAQPSRLKEGPGGIPAGRCGKTWKLENNALGLVSMRLEPDPADAGSIIMEFGLASGKTRRYSCGLDGACRFNPDADEYDTPWESSTWVWAMRNAILALKGRWAAPDAFELEGQYLESSMYTDYHIVFRNDGITVNFEDNENRHEVIRSLAGNAGDSPGQP
jgi:CubicO group peptidase (beta-lactamase class C family)